LLHHGEVLVLFGNGEHLPDELKLDGIQGQNFLIILSEATIDNRIAE